MRKIFYALAMLLVTACSTKTTHLTTIVPGDIIFTVEDVNRATARQNITVSKYNPIIFIFPIGMPNLNSALNDALEEGRGDTMTNITITEEFKWFIIFGYNKLTLTGNVVNTHR